MHLCGRILIEKQQDFLLDFARQKSNGIIGRRFHSILAIASGDIVTICRRNVHRRDSYDPTHTMQTNALT